MAIPRPMPELAPVINAFCPLSTLLIGQFGITTSGIGSSYTKGVMTRCSFGGRFARIGFARLEQLGDQAGPTGLVRSSGAAPGIAIKKLEEKQIIAKIW